ncbi:uncharacterized protein LOC125269706 [Megalobrama amblycephala]|uniref:uncharacterized protein LOC125269706 n=1 Tax=Megalobrama amblycephala TaxID=75352 RepID=UPI002013E58B|nr:uncharacterized protein LOC125269706 [Megalobrama amblycephala]
MARHLQLKHMDETDVAHAFSFPLGSKERKKRLESLRNKGDWRHNQQVLKEGKGEIVTWKQPSKNSSVSDYLPCQHCFAMFKKVDLWRHDKTCRDKNENSDVGTKRKRIQSVSSRLLPMQTSSDGIQNVIHNMLQDNITAHVRGDEMICKYGHSLFARKGREQSQHRYIAQKLRELGRFVLAAKKINPKIGGLKDLVDPTKFNLAIEAAREVSHFNPDKTEYGKPSTAVKIGFSLKAATETWIGHCMMVSDVVAEKKTKKFKELLDKMWSNYVATNAHSSMEQNKWNKDESVPLTKDILVLQNHLRAIEDKAKADLKQTVTVAAYKRLSESLLAQVIVFNKKREGEASRITLEMFLKADSGQVNKDIYETLSPVEKILSHRLTRMVTRGKRGRKVPVLFLDRTKASIDFMIELRDKVGVLKDNPFLFANIGTTTNIRGCDCLRKFSIECKVDNPQLLRSTNLRKHVATLCQLLDLSNQELEQVAKFMGHDIRVHCNYYRQTDKTFQVAKVGKLLFAMEGGAEALKGNSLQTLDSAVYAQTEILSRSEEERHSSM